MEATQRAAENLLGTKGQKKGETEVQNGLATPEATPGVDAARVEADRARQAAEAAAAAAAAKGQQDQEMGEASDPEDGDYQQGGNIDEEENEARNRVMSCGSKEYRKILGVQETYDTPAEEKREILNAYRDLGSLIHPDFTDAAGAEKAFRRVKMAATKLGLEKQYIEEVEFWDGEAEFSEVEFEQESPDDKTSGPNDAIQQIYKKAAQYLNKLIQDPNDETTFIRLRSMNNRIKTQNEEDRVIPVEQWTIDVEGLGAQFNKAKPFYERLLNDEHDEDAKQELEKIRAEMAKSYPDVFSVPIPTPENKAEQKAAADKAAADKAAADKAAADKAAADKAAADKAAANKAKKYPWKTLDTPDGRRIIAGRQHTKLGIVQDRSTLIVATDLSDDPIYDMTSGSNVGTLEVEEYFKLDGIKRLAEKRENGEDVKKWTWRDKKDFVGFLWCTRGKIDTSTFGKGGKAPGTQCCVEMTYGLELMTRSNLVDVIGKKSTDNHIKAYCERKGITPPWAVEADNLKVPKEKKIIAAQTWLAEQGLGNFAAPPVAPAATPAAGLAAGNSAIKSLEDKLAALEKRMESLQTPQVGGSSLDSILIKLEERMGSMEKKVSQVDDLAGKMVQVTGILERLAAKVGLN